jgi:hypothetical protein
MNRRSPTPDGTDAFSEFLPEHPGLWPDKVKTQETIDPFTEFDVEGTPPPVAGRSSTPVPQKRMVGGLVLATFAPAAIISAVIVGHELTASVARVADGGLPPLPPPVFNVSMEQQIARPAPVTLPSLPRPAVESVAHPAASRSAPASERPVAAAPTVPAAILPLTSALLSTIDQGAGMPGVPPDLDSPAVPVANGSAPAGPPAATPASSESNERSDVTAIRTILDRYRSAFISLDASAARAVWPTVDERMLNRAFSQLERQTLVFHRCSVDVSDARAMASCSGQVQFVPKVGSRTPRDETRHWNFSLRRAERDWTIDSVFVR